MKELVEEDFSPEGNRERAGVFLRGKFRGGIIKS
jgi:hypothetical protein